MRPWRPLSSPRERICGTFWREWTLSASGATWRPFDRTDFDEMVVVAVYYLWRPLKGDPLSLERVTVDGAEVRIGLELEQDPQGRERPFLMAPLYVTALEREDLPDNAPLEFVFLVNGEESVKRNPGVTSGLRFTSTGPARE